MSWFGASINILSKVPRLAEAYGKVFGADPESKKLIGDWLGISREFKSVTRIWGPLRESVKIDIRQRRLAGTVTTTDPPHRVFEITGGSLKPPFLTVEIRVDDPDRGPGAMVLLLRGKADAGLFRGYALAYDRDEKKLMVSPYILTRQNDWHEIEAQHSAWLSQDTYLSLPII